MAELAFASFRLDVRTNRLWQNGREVRLRPKSLALLRYLASRPRRLVTRDELVREVWNGTALSEHVVNTYIHDLRRVLGEESIETVFRLGYRFALAVTEQDER